MWKQTEKTISLTLLSVCLLSGFSVTAGAVPDDLFACTTSRDANQDILINFKEIQITLPASWSKKCQITTADSCATFYQIQSHKLYAEEFGYEDGGMLFQLCYSEDTSFTDLPVYAIIGDTAAGHYYVSYPDDTNQEYAYDEAAAAEYQAMADDVAQTISTAIVKPEYAVASAGEAAACSSDDILPHSSDVCISEDELTGLTGNEIQMAINEIYARHHRKFVLPEVQRYFDGKPWYDGYIEATDFDPGCMNSCEGQNIDLMVTYMKKNGITSTFGSGSSSGESSQTASDGAAASQPSSDHAADTIDIYGTVITKGSSFFRIQQPDGTVIQLWYDPDKLAQMGDTSEYLIAGVTASAAYDPETYEALRITVW